MNSMPTETCGYEWSTPVGVNDGGKAWHICVLVKQHNTAKQTWHECSCGRKKSVFVYDILMGLFGFEPKSLVPETRILTKLYYNPIMVGIWRFGRQSYRSKR